MAAGDRQQHGHLRARTLPALLLAALVLPGGLKAQQYGFTQLTPRDGLAQSQVRCMAQDKAGYLWFGTLGGASRFDGLDFTNFGLRDGLPDPQVNALLGASDGTVWLGCGTSLVHFDGRAMQVVPLTGNTGESRVVALAEGGDGTVYVGTDGSGLWTVRDGLAAVPAQGISDTARHVRTLLTTPDGDLLVGLRNGLLRGRGELWTAVPLPVPASVSSLARASDGTLWAGTYGDGVLEIPVRGTPKVHDEATGLLQNIVRAVLVDGQGRVWTATKFGMDLLDKGRMRAYTVHQGMPNDNIWCLFEDGDGDLWVGTDGAGVLRYTGESYVTFTVTDGLCSDLVMAAVGDHAGDMWLGTYGNGVCRLDGMAQITTLEGLPNNTIWSAARSADSSLWFGTSEGLCRIRHGRVMPLSPEQSLDGQRVLALYAHPSGNLWCGTRDGLFIVRPDGAVDKLTELDGIALRGIRSIKSDPEGIVWLATDKGLVRVASGSATAYTTTDGLGRNTLFCLAFDARGRLWAGTSNGLTCHEQGRFSTVDLGTDFGSNYVNLLLCDPAGRLWAGTNNGLFHFDPDSLLHNPQSKEHITEEDGLRGMEFNLNASYIGPRGQLFFGTNAGLLMHDPVRDGRGLKRDPPIARITGISSYLEPVPGSDSLNMGTGPKAPLEVGYRRNHLGFTYTAVVLANGRHVRFQYRMAGFDPDWLPPTEVRFASYSNLPHGNYAFEVRAADRQGRWGPTARVELQIPPPIWLRWWFFLLCAALLALGLLGLMRVRGIRREREERTRNLILRSRMLQLEQQALNANMNRHFIFNALNSIQYSINRQDRAMANKYLTSFAKLIRKNLDASQSDTTTLAEELERLELYLVLEHMRFKDKFHYAITVAPDVDTHQVDIPAMMLQPYVENSIWHGILPSDRPGRVDVEVGRTAEGRVRVRIVDNGVGVDNSLESKQGRQADHISRGIEITKGRADILRNLQMADIRIQGPEQMEQANGGTGTQVIIELPSSGNHPLQTRK